MRPRRPRTGLGATLGGRHQHDRDDDIGTGHQRTTDPADVALSRYREDVEEEDLRCSASAHSGHDERDISVWLLTAGDL
jgi:hypothetical protein